MTIKRILRRPHAKAPYSRRGAGVAKTDPSASVAAKPPKAKILLRRPHVKPASTTDNSSAEVGYGKPPVHTRFQPGQSGNPKGRPKANRSLSEVVLQEATRSIKVDTATGVKRITKLEALARTVGDGALRGDPKAIAHQIRLLQAAEAKQPPIVPGKANSEPSLSAEEIELMKTLVAGDRYEKA
jgi:hypothetical protein